ncbi:MAG: Spy/CpxP family protein refolding chaperone [Bacteroidales bacterium]|nr:Spy/CpxP family protein refolding chaperone [Bacteroidales bacterium]
MKTRSIIIIALMIFVSGSIFAQGNPNANNKKADRPFMNIPDLTEDQKDQIKEMRIMHMKEVMPLKNELNEKEAHLQTISTGENVDLNKVYTVIDEIAEIRVNTAKKRAAFRQEVRKVLTEDQRVFFDMHSGHKKNKHMMHKPHHRG